jgi:gamma-butyrobetaine dioxygenase
VTGAAYADELESALMSLDGVFAGLEPVDELSHALQCAQLARAENAPRELVAAALFHDVARAPMVASAFPGVAHERAGAMWLEPRLGREVAWLVGAHVAAKLYLLEHDPGYAALLSDESRKSAIGQRAPALAELTRGSSWPLALRLRRWDDQAKRRDAELVDPSELLAIVRPLARTLG